MVFPHKFYADFVVRNKMVLEIKSIGMLNERHPVQCINHLKVPGVQTIVFNTIKA